MQRSGGGDGRLRAQPRRHCAGGLLDDHPAGQGDHAGELHVGARSSYAAAGFCEVVQPSSRRVVMRIDFDDA